MIVKGRKMLLSWSFCSTQKYIIYKSIGLRRLQILSSALSHPLSLCLIKRSEERLYPQTDYIPQEQDEIMLVSKTENDHPTVPFALSEEIKTPLSRPSLGEHSEAGVFGIFHCHQRIMFLVREI